MKRVKYIKNSKYFKPLDLIAYGLIVVLIVLTIVIAFQPKGNTVKIVHNGELLYTLPLDKNKTVDLQICDIVIDNGTVKVIHSDCPNKLCEKTGKISKVGQKIICLPNKLVISIEGKSKWEVVV